jgi:hypothetical protein
MMDHTDVDHAIESLDYGNPATASMRLLGVIAHLLVEIRDILDAPGE